MYLQLSESHPGSFTIHTHYTRTSPHAHTSPPHTHILRVFQDVHSTLLALAAIPNVAATAPSVRGAASVLLDTLPTHTPTLERLKTALSSVDPAAALATVLDEAGAHTPTPSTSARLIYVLQCCATLLMPCAPPRLAPLDVQQPLPHTLVFLSTNGPHVVLRRGAAAVRALQAHDAPQLLSIITTMLSLVAGMLSLALSLAPLVSQHAAAACDTAAMEQDRQQHEPSQGPDTQPVDVLDAGMRDTQLDAPTLALVRAVVEHSNVLQHEMLVALLDMACVLGELAVKVCV